jgi:hypothetical protein
VAVVPRAGLGGHEIGRALGERPSAEDVVPQIGRGYRRHPGAGDCVVRVVAVAAPDKDGVAISAEFELALAGHYSRWPARLARSHLPAF